MYTHNQSYQIHLCVGLVKIYKEKHWKKYIVPRWILKKGQNHSATIWLNAMGNCLIPPHDIAQEYLDLVPTPESCSTTPKILTLCKSITSSFTEKHIIQLCVSFSTQPNHREKYTQCCPDPEQISAFLKQTFNFDVVLTAKSKICKQCYLYHHRILSVRADSQEKQHQQWLDLI